MEDLENNNWIILDSLVNIYEIYANLPVMTLLSLSDFWITQAESRLKGELVKASFMFVTIFKIFMIILREKALLSLPVPNTLK